MSSSTRSERLSAAVAAPQTSEAPTVLTADVPRTLGVVDQFGFWGNLGVSLLGFSGALTILQPEGAPGLTMTAAVVALVVGSVLGGLILGATLVIGSRTGSPAMVLLRGLVGAKASIAPTILNICQCVGWGIFELVVITDGLRSLTHEAMPRWVCVVLGGIVTTALTIRPLGAIRVLRKYVSGLVVLAVAVLAIGLFRHPVPHVAGSWHDFWPAVDSAMAVTISWVPLGADYSRHARSARGAFTGGFVGYGLTQVACYLVGLVALAQLHGDPDRVFGVFLDLPLGVVAFAVLVIRETDQSFANVYSTAVSIQNLRPRWDRRVLSLLLGVLITVAALSIDINDYTDFLYLIGAVFIPLAGTLLVAWWRTPTLGGVRRWDVGSHAPSRPGIWLAWLLGFVTYQAITPAPVAGWDRMWTSIGNSLDLSGHQWLSASIASFVVAAVLAVPFAGRARGSG